MSVSYRDFMDDAWNYTKELIDPNSDLAKRRQWQKERDDAIAQEGKMALQKQGDSGALARQALMNTGALQTEQERGRWGTEVADIGAKASNFNSSETARAHLGATDITAGTNRANTLTNAETERYKTDQNLLAGKNDPSSGILKIWAENTDMSPTSLDKLVKAHGRLREQAPRGDDARLRDKPGDSPTQAEEKPAITGAQSMEFRSGARPLTADEESEKYMGMIPGVKTKPKKNIFGW